MGESSEKSDNAARELSALLEENRRLAQRFLELEEASRRRIEKLEAANVRLSQGDADMRRLVEEAAFGFMLLNRELGVVSANRALLDMLGYAMPELSGLDFRQFVYVEKLPAFTAMAEKAVRAGVAKADVDLASRKGRLVSCRLSAGQWKDEKGDYQGLYVLVMDISHEVRAAEHMERLRLIARENEKTREILLDVVGREIRTPANSIAGMSRMLLDTDLDNRQRELAAVVHTSADALARLVDNLLDMAMPETSDAKPRLAPLVVSGLCHGVIDFFMGRAEDKGLNLDVSIAPGVPEAVVGDAGRLRRVLAHLVDNAVKFTDAGRITISVDAIGDKLRFMVSDTGRGLRAGAGDEIFGDFASAGSISTRRYGGLGVGLAVCRRLVGIMGGKIGFESAPGRGSEFHFTIPLAPAAALEHSREAGEIESASALHLPPLRILAAEGNPLALRALRAVLGLDGHQVVAVDNGIEAAERRRNGEFDVMLLDAQMPGLDGLQALKIIRDDETAAGRKRVPALAVTAAAAAKSPEEYRRLGFDGVVMKPIRPVELMSAVAAAAGVEPLSAAPQAAPAAYFAAAAGSSIRRIDGRQFANIREIMQDEHFVGVLRVFIEDSVPAIVGLVAMASAPEPDRERIAFSAGKSRGMAGYLGLSSLADALAQLEKAGKEGATPERFAELAADLQMVTDDTLEELKRIAPRVFATLSGDAAEGANGEKKHDHGR